MFTFFTKKKIVKKWLLGRSGNNKEYYERGVGWQTARHWCTHIAADAYAALQRQIQQATCWLFCVDGFASNKQLMQPI